MHHAGLDSRCWPSRGASLREPGRQFYSVQLDLHDSTDGAWLQAPRHSNVLVIGGDHLNFAGSGLEPTQTHPARKPTVAGGRRR